MLVWTLRHFVLNISYGNNVWGQNCKWPMKATLFHIYLLRQCITIIRWDNNDTFFICSICDARCVISLAPRLLYFRTLSKYVTKAIITNIIMLSTENVRKFNQTENNTGHIRRFSHTHRQNEFYCLHFFRRSSQFVF